MPPTLNRAPKWDPNGPHFPGGFAPRPPFSRPSASKWVPGPRPISLNGSLKNGSQGPIILIFPKTQFHFFRGPISSFGHPPYFLEAGFGLIRPRQYGCLKFQPGWQELLPVGDPQRSQTYVFGPFPPGAFIFDFPKTDMGPIWVPFGGPQSLGLGSAGGGATDHS